MADNAMTVGKALLDVPMKALITNLGLAIADAQQALDMKMLRVAQMMAGEYEDANGDKQSSLVKFDGEELSLLELGFTPTMYQFAETTLEIKVSISITSSEEESHSTFDLDANMQAEGSIGFLSAEASASLSVSTVSAEYSSKYQYTAEGSSVLRTKLMPLPPPPLLEQRIRRIVDRRAAAKFAG